MKDENDNGLVDRSGAMIVGHLLIRDLGTGEVILNQRTSTPRQTLVEKPLDVEDEPEATN